MQISGERRRTSGLGDLSRLAGMASQCGSCLVGLAAMMTKADASTIPTSDEKEKSDSSIVMKVALTMLVMWTTLVDVMTM